MNERPIVVLLGASAQRQAMAAPLLDDIATVRTAATVLAAATLGPRIVIVDLAAPDLESALRTLEDVRATMPGVQLVALGASKDPDLILRAMRAGAREFAVLGQDNELADVIASLITRAAEERPGGKIVSMFPAKGGMGATTLATNLAAALRAGPSGRKERRRVLVVDFDRQLGDVLVFLDMTSSYSIPEVIKNLHRLDRELLLSSLACHSPGLYVLAHSHSLEDADAVTAAQVPALLQMLARHFDYVLCDGFRGFDELSVAVLDASHQIELLMSQDVPSLKNAKYCLEVFDRLGYEESKVNLVVNRYHKGGAIDLSAIAENLGRAARCTLANDYRAAIGAVNRGVLLSEAAPRSKLTEDIAQLATRLSGGAPGPLGGFFQTLFGRGERPRKDNADPERKTSPSPGKEQGSPT